LKEWNQQLPDLFGQYRSLTQQQQQQQQLLRKKKKVRTAVAQDAFSVGESSDNGAL
jgi:CHASE3 domain sensor protein